MISAGATHSLAVKYYVPPVHGRPGYDIEHSAREGCSSKLLEYAIRSSIWT